MKKNILNDEKQIIAWLNDHAILLGVIKDNGETEYIKVEGSELNFKGLVENVIKRSDLDSEYVAVPNMSLHKDDLKSLYEGRDDFAEKCKEIDSLGKDQMEEIAKKLSKGLMQDWSLVLKIVYED